MMHPTPAALVYALLLPLAWVLPVEAFFRRSANGWTLVGFKRLGQRSNGGARRGSV
jgi:hypothetical protein